jgi:alcohol dehydrogenase
MKAARITQFGPVREVTTHEDVPAPTVVPGKVLVSVHASGLNPIDWKMASGLIERVRQVHLPYTPGSDFSGIITEVGEGVSGFRPGDAVYGMASTQRKGSGALAEFALADPRFVFRRPTTPSSEEAAAVPMTGLRAWSVIHEWLQIRRGERILIHGGAGGLGVFAIQIATHLGAEVATTVSERDLGFAKSLGARTVIDYRSEDFTSRVHDLDAVLDTVGGDTFQRSFNVLKRGGRIATMLGTGGPGLAQAAGATFVDQGESATPQAFHAMNELLDRGVVKVHLDRVFPLDRIGEALHHIETGHPRGKVVVTVP